VGEKGREGTALGVGHLGTRRHLCMDGMSVLADCFGVGAGLVRNLSKVRVALQSELLLRDMIMILITPFLLSDNLSN
jgi:hypothetical protein